jgi:hypothetical protein
MFGDEALGEGMRIFLTGRTAPHSEALQLQPLPCVYGLSTHRHRKPDVSRFAAVRCGSMPLSAYSYRTAHVPRRPLGHARNLGRPDLHARLPLARHGSVDRLAAPTPPRLATGPICSVIPPRARGDLCDQLPPRKACNCGTGLCKSPAPAIRGHDAGGPKRHCGPELAVPMADVGLVVRVPAGYGMADPCIDVRGLPHTWPYLCTPTSVPARIDRRELRG